MASADDELLREQVISAWRPRARDGAVRAHPAWHDLPEAERARAYDEAASTRRMEAALDPDGLSTTARAVLARLAPAPR
ncbi:MAG TPA: hypothetical protein VND93_08905 [Myxococcales bacterium]|nr:hypothetical protein [Myxococcales bacterium]